MRLFIIGIINLNAPIAFSVYIGTAIAFMTYHQKVPYANIFGVCIYILACVCLILLNIYIQRKSHGIKYVNRFLIIIFGTIIGTFLLYLTKGMKLYSPIQFYMIEKSIPYYLIITIAFTCILYLLLELLIDIKIANN